MSKSQAERWREVAQLDRDGVYIELGRYRNRLRRAAEELDGLGQSFMRQRMQRMIEAAEVAEEILRGAM